MSFTDHKITQFTHRISELADQPNLPADELKARFDACPEELRESVNGICDDADRLEARVEGIVVETFGDTIDKEMLSTELAAELDAKAEAAALTAETTTRAAETASLGSRMSAAEGTISSHTTQIAQKNELYCGTYTGDGEDSKTISLGFTPKGVLVVRQGFRFGEGEAVLALQGHPAQSSDAAVDRICEVVSGGFKVYDGQTEHGDYFLYLNRDNTIFHYLAFK